MLVCSKTVDTLVTIFDLNGLWNSMVVHPSGSYCVKAVIVFTTHLSFSNMSLHDHSSSSNWCCSRVSWFLRTLRSFRQWCEEEGIYIKQSHMATVSCSGTSKLPNHLVPSNCQACSILLVLGCKVCSCSFTYSLARLFVSSISKMSL